MDILIMLIVSDKSKVGRERSNLRYIQTIMKLSQGINKRKTCKA